MSSAAGAELDPSVCYRHPDRQSWILCQRCGRTICPECQIQAPVGVQCPECVREANGGSGVRWTSARPASNVSSFKRKPKWQQWAGRMLRPDNGAPVVTWTVLGLELLVFVVLLVTQNALLTVLVPYPGMPVWQIWTFFTSMVVQPQIFSLVLNIVFFLLIAPTVERMMGRGRFLTVLLAGSAVGAAAMVIAGSPAYGLSGAMFGMFAAYFVIARNMGASTTQFLVIIGLNLVLTIFLSPGYLPMLIGGLIGGGGAAALFFLHRDRRNSKPATPYWQIAAGVGVFIVVALVRSSLAI